MARISALAAVAFVVTVASLFVGDTWIAPREVADALIGRGAANTIIIVRDLRLPRALLAFVVGAALAGSGAIFQGLFRNPLADPFVVGISGGAALGAVAAIVAGVQVSVLGLGAVTLASFAGALGVAALVWSISSVGGRANVTTLVLAGFAVGAFCAAIVSILVILHTKNWGEAMLWMMGSVSRADGWMRVRVALPFVVLSLAAASVYARDLNVMILGEEPAQQLGIEVERVKKVLLAAGTVAAAAAVAMCGVIGFVGLIVPHVVRRLAGPDHRTLLPLTVLGGGAFLVAADIVARVVLPPGGLPVGAVTALAGAPFFLFLLRRRR
jgi:iron complex transport system permease protein